MPAAVPMCARDSAARSTVKSVSASMTHSAKATTAGHWVAGSVRARAMTAATLGNTSLRQPTRASLRAVH